MTERVSLQTDKAKSPAQILLWGECQRHKDLNMGHTHCQSVTVTAAKLIAEAMEFLRAGNYGAHCTYGIPQLE